MKFYNDNSLMLQEAKKSRFQPNVVIQILVFILVFLVSEIAASIIPGIAIFADMISKSLSNNIDVYEYTSNLSSNIMIITLFCTAIITLLTIIHCRFIEKRSLTSIGFIKKNAVKQYCLGYLIGIILFSTAFFIAVLTGAIKINGFNTNIVWLTFILFFFGFLIQGMSEEVLLRGYFMVSLSNRTPMIAAILINSVVFAMLHLANNGISILAFINLILFGVFASIYVLRTENLWGACAIHSAWNFFQGNVFGILVSGTDSFTSILSITNNDSLNFINGGSFGMEGGIAVSIVLIIGIVLLLFYKRKSATEHI